MLILKYIPIGNAVWHFGWKLSSFNLNIVLSVWVCIWDHRFFSGYLWIQNSRGDQDNQHFPSDVCLTQEFWFEWWLSTVHYQTSRSFRTSLNLVMSRIGYQSHSQGTSQRRSFSKKTTNTCIHTLPRALFNTTFNVSIRIVQECYRCLITIRFLVKFFRKCLNNDLLHYWYP